MIIRVVTYHALPNKNVERWMKSIASELRAVRGMRHIEFIKSQDNPSQYAALMHFTNKEQLEHYKLNENGTYQNLVRNMRETWMDTSKRPLATSSVARVMRLSGRVMCLTIGIQNSTDIRITVAATTIHGTGSKKNPFPVTESDTANKKACGGGRNGSGGNGIRIPAQ